MVLSVLTISITMIKEIHQELMKNVRGAERNPGEFRQTQNKHLAYRRE